MKITGAILVFAAFAWCGAALSMKMKKRCDFLESFITALQILETEISFLSAELKEAFEKAAQIGCADVFLYTAKNIEKLGIDRSWAEALDKAPINGEDKKILLLLAAKLGKTDTKGQIKHIKYVAGMANELKKKAEKDYETKGGLCRKGGALLGVFAVIMLV